MDLEHRLVDRRGRCQGLVSLHRPQVQRVQHQRDWGHAADS